MATIDMQQTISSQVTGSDRVLQQQQQQQEEIQLTELLPVKRIRENGIFKDADTTDALKILRSFTVDNCNDVERNLSFCKKIEDGTRDDGKQWGREEIRKKRIQDKNVGNGCKEISDDRKSEVQNRIEKSKGKSVGKKLIDHGNSTWRKGKRTIDKEQENEIDKGNYLSNYNELSATYLDVEKNLSDEVYVFRRELIDEQKRNGSSENAEESYKRTDYSKNTDGELFDQISTERQIRENCVFESDARVANSINVGRSYLLEKGKEKKNNRNNSDRFKKVRSVSEEEEEEEENGVTEKKYCCVVCEARFKGSGGLRNHYKIVHGAGPVFKCDECGKEFPLKERLKLHVRTHTGFKPYKCPECDKSFARGGQLVQHRRTHSQVKPYRCGLCSGTFTCAANLALHVKRHNGQKDHKCEICGRAFVRRDALKKHLECLHRDVKSFLCVICNKTFKGHLPQHMRTHARDRPHGCATCGQRFAQKSQLTVHQRTHSGQRPFRCLVCWQAFAHSTALKLHTRRHTGERPFKCTECNAGFTQLPHWKKHMRCIHGRKEPYACRKCNSFFRIKNDLECHEKSCHPELENELGTSDFTPIAAASTSPPGLRPTSPSSLSNETLPDKHFSTSNVKYKIMTVERMRLLLAVLLKRISKQEKLDELGFGKRLIDEVLHDSLISAGKDPVASDGLSELETLTKNLEIFLKWTVPKEHWEKFRKLNKTPEDILETLTAT